MNTTPRSTPNPDDATLAGVAPPTFTEEQMEAVKADAWKTTQCLYETTQVLGRTIEQRDAAEAECARLRTGLTEARDAIIEVPCDAKFSQDCRSCGVLDILNFTLDPVRKDRP